MFINNWLAWLRQAMQLDAQTNNPIILHGLNALTLEMYFRGPYPTNTHKHTHTHTHTNFLLYIRDTRDGH